jgi:transposase
MNRRPPHEPARIFHPSHRLQDDASRNARWLGCRGCPDFEQCGGLHTDAGIFDCGDLCSCADRSKRDMVCRNKPETF